jgi:hypothetical protein
MNFYEGRNVEEITICYGASRYKDKWYALVSFKPEKERVFRNTLHDSLEIKLKDPRLTKAIPQIISELEKIKVSTTYLRIKPYEETKKAA